jgi:hypothetical protein
METITIDKDTLIALIYALHISQDKVNQRIAFSRAIYEAEYFFYNYKQIKKIKKNE